MSRTLKIKWLQSFLRNGGDVWFSSPALVFSSYLNVILRCPHCQLNSLPSNNRVLLQWKMIYKNNFSPHNIPLWNTRVILSRRKSIFLKDWMKTQLWSIMHLIDKNGNLLELDEFNAKYYQIYTVKNMKVTLNIPVVLQSIKNNLNDTLSLKLHHIKTDCGFCKQKCNNRF